MKNRLFEDPDRSGALGDNMVLSWDDEFAYPFGANMANGLVKVGPASNSHDILDSMSGFAFKDYEGRIWPADRIISFWEAPKKRTLILILKLLLNDPELQKYDLEMEDFDDFLFDIDVEPKFFTLEDYPNNPYEEMKKQSDAAWEKFRKDHEKTPADPTKKKPEMDKLAGKKIDVRNAWRRAKPFESFYPQLNESPDEVVLGTKTLNHSKGYAFPFSTSEDGSSVYVGDNLSTHGSFSIPNDGDYYQGRIWPKDKFISFWNRIPKDRLETILFELENYFNTEGTEIVHVNDIEEFIIEIPDLKECMAHNEYIGEKFTFANYPTNINKSKIETCRTPHQKPQSKEGYGSKHPNYQSAQKQKRMMAAESFYPKLNESPDEVKAPHPEHDYYRNIAEFDDEDAYAFGFKDEKALISKAKKSHGDMLKEIGIDPWDVSAIDARKYFRYPGRIWIKKKLISFWLYPKDNSELHKLMELLEDTFSHKLNIKLDIWNDFKIEINIDESGLDNFGAHRYGEWERFRMHDIKIIPVKEYKSSKNNSAQAMASPHRKPESSVGFGSKHPQYQGKQKEKRYMAAESYYPQLNESPDMIEARNLKKITGMNSLGYKENAFPFGYYAGGMMCGKSGETHVDMAHNRYGMQLKRASFKYAGRVWPEQRIISFWNYPTPEEFKKVLDDIVEENRRKYGDSNYVDFNDPKWTIEVISKELDREKSKYSQSEWDYAMDSKLIPFSEYAGSEDQSKKKQGQKHVDSPMDKEKLEEPVPNVGSKHPKYQGKQAEKRYMAAESYYPQLNENPNEIIDPEYWKNVKNPHITADQYNRIRWKDTDNITFSYYDGKLAAQSNEDDQEYTHYDLARDFRPDNQKYSVAGNGRGDYGGRLYTKYKVVTFWRFPETHKALYDILSDLENKMGIQILDDPEWVIEIPAKETKGGIGGPWQPSQHKIGDVKFIPLKDYKGGHIRTREELGTPHPKPDPNYGGGSKLTAWDAEKNIKQRQKDTTSESFYPKIK